MVCALPLAMSASGLQSAICGLWLVILGLRAVRVKDFDDSESCKICYTTRGEQSRLRLTWTAHVNAKYVFAYNYTNSTEHEKHSLKGC